MTALRTKQKYSYISEHCRKINVLLFYFDEISYGIIEFKLDYQ